MTRAYYWYALGWRLSVIVPVAGLLAALLLQW